MSTSPALEACMESFPNLTEEQFELARRWATIEQRARGAIPIPSAQRAIELLKPEFRSDLAQHVRGVLSEPQHLDRLVRLEDPYVAGIPGLSDVSNDDIWINLVIGSAIKRGTYEEAMRERQGTGGDRLGDPYNFVKNQARNLVFREDGPLWVAESRHMQGPLKLAEVFDVSGGIRSSDRNRLLNREEGIAGYMNTFTVRLFQITEGGDTC
mgnify:CR=1 FL=1